MLSSKEGTNREILSLNSLCAYVKAKKADQYWYMCMLSTFEPDGKMFYPSYLAPHKSRPSLQQRHSTFVSNTDGIFDNMAVGMLSLQAKQSQRVWEQQSTPGKLISEKSPSSTFAWLRRRSCGSRHLRDSSGPHDGSAAHTAKRMLPATRILFPFPGPAEHC